MAGKAIKGITIKLDGDNGELTQSMTQADRAISSVENSLKAVNRALKLDPSNTDLLKQKQELLNQEIEETKTKLEAEQEAGQRAAEALEAGAITQEEYNALQAEIQNTTTKLAELERQAQQFGSVMGQQLQQAGEKMQEVGQNVENFGKSMTQNVTVPIMAVGTASVAAFNEVDHGLDTIIVRTGATGDEIEGLQTIMNNLATTMPITFDAAGEAIGEVATRFGVSGQRLEDLSRAFLEFSRVTGADVTNAVDDVQKALAAFGLSGEDAEALLDRLVAVSQETGANVGTLANGLVQNSAAFEELGMSIDQAAVFMGQMETSGANAESVMQALRKALKSTAQDGGDMSQALIDLQNQILNGTDGMDGLTTAYEMFGRSGDQIYSAVRNGTLDFTNLGQEVEEVGGTLAETFEATISSNDEMTMAVNEVKAAASEFGEDIGNDLVPILGKLADAISAVSSWWTSLDDSQRKIIINALAVAAALGPIIAVIGSVISSVGGLITTLGTLSILTTGTVAPGIAGLGATITGVLIPGFVAIMEPVAAVIAVIGALVAIFMAVKSVFDNWDAWVWGFEQIWIRLKETVEMVGEAISGAVESIGEYFENIWGNITDGFWSIIDSAVTWGSDLIDSFVDGIMNGIGTVTSAVSNVASVVSDYLGFSEPDKGPLSNFHTFAPDMIDLWNEGIEQNLGSVARTSALMGSTVAGNVQPDYTEALNGISGQLGSIAGDGQQITIPVYIGSDRIGTAVARANNRNAYISGGR